MGKSGIKVIDFGSACFYDRKEFTYIQSRYYRAPEIVLIKPYDRKIDIWSLGCVVFELFTGSPLFPSRNENEQMAMINSTLGVPPQYFLDVMIISCRHVKEVNNFDLRKKIILRCQ
jgi:serine/threonine protein kinase